MKKGTNGMGAYNYLAKGMTGAGVQEMQGDLKSLGFSVSVDGIFGDETYRAVKNFQYTWGSLTIDGIVGMQTATAIKEAVTMLGEARWNPQTDPMTAPQTVYQTEVPQPPRITTRTQPSEAAILPEIPLTVPSFIPVVGGLQLDWKWIGLGALAVFGILKLTGRGKE